VGIYGGNCEISEIEKEFDRKEKIKICILFLNFYPTKNKEVNNEE